MCEEQGSSDRGLGLSVPFTEGDTGGERWSRHKWGTVTGRGRGYGEKAEPVFVSLLRKEGMEWNVGGGAMGPRRGGGEGRF